MPVVPVTALHPLLYQSRSLEAGDVFEAEPIDAAILARAGQVALRGHLVPAPPPPPRVKRRYRRRDLTAEA
jgi:hypothetical protein